MDSHAFSMVILAGGKSRRMGVDKADLVYKGRTFLEHQIEKGKRLGIQNILVSGYRGDSCSVPVIPDRYPGRGPLAGLEACFRKMETKYCLVLSVDVPLVPEEELNKLMNDALVCSARAIILKHGEREESLIAVYSTDLADEMEEEMTERKGSVFAFLNRIGYETYESKREEELFQNINDPSSYQIVIDRV